LKEDFLTATMGKAKGGGAKKKGPKGKKARAKAKLEKQWGEHVDEDEQKASKMRRGKSRLQKTEPKKGVHFGDDEAMETSSRRFEEEGEEGNIAHVTTLESDEDDDEEDMQLQGGAFSSLLHSISKKSKKSKKQSAAGSDADEDDEEEEEEMEAEESESDAEEDEEVVPDDDDGAVGTGADDPFSAHFSRDALPEKESDIIDLLVEAQSMNKVNTPALDDSLDVQLSQQLVEDLGGNLKSNQDADRSQEMWSRMAAGLFAYNRKVLKENWKKANRSAFKTNTCGVVSIDKDSSPCYLNSLQSVMYPALTSYADLLVTAESAENTNAMNNIISMHILNHILTSRGRVSRNNKRVKDAEAKEEEVAEDVRDQGYTRPTVLILLPTRGVCYSFIKNSMLDLLGDNANVENMDRFDAEFGPVEEEDDENVDGDAARRHRKKVLETKGHEWNNLYGDKANSDDDFKVGISFSPKAVKETKRGNKSAVGVRLYTDFYKSDIIVASPLALKMATSGDGEDDDNDGDTDFLSSIEICYIGSSDVLMMQNWDHVNAAFDSMNEQPTRNNTTDFSRVREYLLAGQARYWRQLIVCSKFTDPSILSTFKRNATSVAGTLKVRSRVPVIEASLANVMIPTKQVFQRVPCKSFASQGASRLEYFEQHVLPQIQRTKQKHTMLYIPSYFEFIAVRNMLLKQEMDFVSVTEYARGTEVSRGRARFLQGRKPIMLYTGRAHFFSRHTIKGAKHLLFFGLPEHSEFYAQIVNMLNMGISADDELGAGGGSSSCLALFTKYEAHALERICGKQNCERMLKGEKSTFMFMS
jgi:U3 small nucleolar RNA-associated protein 25